MVSQLSPACVLMVSWRYLGGVPVVSAVSRLCLGGISVVSCWYLGGVPVVSPCFGSVLVVSRLCLDGGILVVSCWYLGGVPPGVSVMYKSYLGCVLVSWWCPGGVSVVSLLVVSW